MFTNFRNMFHISNLDVSPIHSSSDPGSTSMPLSLMCSWMSPVLPGSATPGYVAGYVTP